MGMTIRIIMIVLLCLEGKIPIAIHDLPKKCRRRIGFYGYDWWIYGNDDFVITKPDRQQETDNKQTKIRFLDKTGFQYLFYHFCWKLCSKHNGCVHCTKYKIYLCCHEMKFNNKQIEGEITQKSLQNTIFYLVKAFSALLTSSKIYLKENCSWHTGERLDLDVRAIFPSKNLSKVLLLGAKVADIS